MSNKTHEADCEQCTLKPQPYVPTYMPSDEDLPILWVGQAPGDTEQYTQIPFTGPAGKMHWSLCRQAGLRKDHLAHANVVSCYPPGDRKPSAFEVRCCHGRLRRDILLLKPKLIIALGEVALQALTGSAKIMSQRGQFLNLLPDYSHQCKVLAALHPSYIMRQRQWIPAGVECYKLIERYLNGELRAEFNPEFLYDPSADDLREYLDTTEVVACDTETTGLDTLSDQIIGHSFSKSPDSACAVMYKSPDDPRWAVAKEFFEDPKRLKCWQNGPFDCSIARTHGILDDGYVFDTMLAQQMLYSDLPADLDFLRAQYTRVPPYKPAKSSMKAIASWGAQKVLEYACMDAIATYRVMEAQKKLLGNKQLQLIETQLIPLVRTLDRMRRRGVRVDVNSLAALFVQCAPYLEEAEAEFAKVGVNPRSPQQIKAFFGLRASDEQTLKDAMKRDHPKSDLMEKLLDYRSVYSLSSKYLKGIYNRLRNGRIHTTFNIGNTGTGRLSSTDPNLQNVPPEMRVIYIPDEGYRLMCADYSQVELWVLGCLADIDGKFFSDLSSGMDVHYIACQICYPWVKLTHGNRDQDFEPRQVFIAKSIVFGTAYGRTPMSIAREFGCTVAEAENWQLKILNHYPELLQYKARVEQQFNARGFLETPFGRIRYVQTLNQSYNYPVQSSAADIIFGSLHRCDAANIDLLLTVHDDIIYQVPEAEFAAQNEIVKQVMERPIPELHNVKFKVSYETGPNWYEMKKLNTNTWELA